MSDSKAAKDDLVAGGLAPLKSFSARQKLAFHLGIITEDESADIEDVRWIRNKAAHVIGSHVEPWDQLFTIAEVATRCERLQFFDHTVNHDTSRRRYALVALHYAMRFENLAAELRRLDAESGARLIAAVEARVLRRTEHLVAVVAGQKTHADG